MTSSSSQGELPAPVTQKAEKSPSSHPLPTTTTTTTTATQHASTDKSAVKVHWARFKQIVSARTASASSESYFDGVEVGKRAGGEHGHWPSKPSLGHGNRWNRGTNPTLSDEDDVRDSNAVGPVDEIIVDSIMPSPYDSADKTSVTQPSSEHGLNERSETIHTDSLDPEPFPNTDTTFADNIWIFLRYHTWPLVVLFFNPHFHSPEEEQKYRKEAWDASKTLALVCSFFFILNWILGCAIHPNLIFAVDQIVYYGIAPALTVPLPLLVYFEIPQRSRWLNWLYQFYLMSSVWIWAYQNLIYMSICGFYTVADGDDHCGGKDFLLVLFYTNALPVMALFALGQNRFFGMVGAIGCLLIMGILIIPVRRSWIRHVIDTILFQVLLLYIHWAKEMAERNLFIFRERIKDQFKKTQKAQINEGKMAESKRRLTSYIFHEVRVPLNTAMLAVQNMEASGMIAKDNSDQDIEFQALEGSLSMMSKVLNDVLDFNRMDAGKFESVSRPYNFHSAIRSVIVPLRLAAAARGLELEVIMDPAIDQIARRAAYQALDQSEEWIRKKMETMGDEEHEPEGLVTGDEMRLRQVVTNLASNALKFTMQGKLTIVTKLISPDPSSLAFAPQPNQLDHWDHSLDRTMTRKSVDTAMGIMQEKKPTVARRRPSLDPKAPPQTPLFDPHGRSIEPLSSSPDAFVTRPSLDPRGSSEATTMPVLPSQALSNQPSRLSAQRLRQHNRAHSGDGKVPKLENIVVRIEVIDTGVGISASDMKNLKLFSPYVQTEIGRSQGGKGSGLGLALVRQIIQLSGGRLGIKSDGEPGKGSTFWIDLNLGVGKKALSMAGSSDSFDPSRASSLSRAKGSKPTPMRPSDLPRQMTSSMTSGMEGRYIATVAPPIQAESALRTIMDQGGLVEMVPTRHSRVVSPDDYPVLVARAMSGDSTTVTSCTRLSDDDGVPTRGKGARPMHLALPPRPGFSPLFATPVDPTSSFSSVISNSPPASALGMGSTVSNPPPAIHPPLLVLVVDDDPLTRRLFTRMLLRLGCVVHTAENGQVALDMLMGAWNKATPGSDMTGSSSIRSFYTPTPTQTVAREDQLHFDVVFLDNQMPIFSGLYVVAQLRAAGRKDLVVGVTGNALRADQDEYLEAGADYILTKPVLERNIRSMLHIAADRRLASGGDDSPPSPLPSPPKPPLSPPP